MNAITTVAVYAGETAKSVADKVVAAIASSAPTATQFDTANYDVTVNATGEITIKQKATKGSNVTFTVSITN